MLRLQREGFGNSIRRKIIDHNATIIEQLPFLRREIEQLLIANR